MALIITGGTLLKENMLPWSESLRGVGESKEEEDASCVVRSFWWEYLRIGGGAEILLVISGGRLEVMTMEVICEIFVMRGMVRSCLREG